MSHRNSSSTSKLRRRLGIAAAGALVLATTTGCSAREIFLFDMPEPVTEQGETMYNLWVGNWITAWPVGVLVWGLIIFCVVAYHRRRRPAVPVQTTYNMPIETMYTVAPLIVVLGLFWYALGDQADVLEVKGDEQNVVNVVGFRWSWGFNYTDQNVYEIGEPINFQTPTGERTQNQDAAPTLWLPVDESARVVLTSPDVIHSFWVVDWLFKMDVTPGKENQFAVTPTEEGFYEGRCAELCGVDHSRMLFNVNVVSRAEFDQHIKDLEARGQVGQLDTGRVNVAGEPNVDGRVL